MTRRIILLFLLVLGFSPAYAALLKGRVTDAKGGTLPFATVFVVGTTTGTTTNAEGEYQLQLQAGSYRVGCQYIGYKQTVVPVVLTEGATLLKDLVLQDQSLDLKEVTVRATDEDPAYKYIRRAISKRAVHLAQIKTFQSRIYLKGVLRNRELGDRVMGKKLKDKDRKEMMGEMGWDSAGKGVIYLCEEVADYYAQGGEDRTHVLSVRESGDPSGFGLSEMPPVLSLYENNPRPFGGVTPRGFVSPIADGALNYYKYKLLGEFVEDERTIYKIAVQPKRPFEPTLAGTIYIVAGDWALHSLDLYATAREGIELLDTLHLQQLFLPVRPDVWVVKSQVIQPSISMFGFDAVGNFVSVYDNQRVNEPVPDSVFNSRVTSSYSRDAIGKDTTYWNETRPIPLESDEQRDFRYKDSVHLVQESPAYKDSVRRRMNRFTESKLLLRGYTYRGKEDRWSLGVRGLIMSTNFNTVEGWNVAPTIRYRQRVDSSNSVGLTLRPRYGFSNDRFQALGTLSYYYSDKHWQNRGWTLSGTAGRYMRQYSGDDPVVPLFNTISSLFFQENYLKLYERTEATLNLKRNGGNGLSWGVSASMQSRNPVQNTTDFSWRSVEGQRFSDNHPAELYAFPWEQHRAAVISGSVTYQPGYTYTDYPNRREPNGSRWPVFTASYTKGLPGIAESKTDYDRWRVSVADRVNMKLAGALSFRLATGGFLNDKYVSLPDLMHLRGNRFIFSGPYLSTFQLAPYYRYSNTEKLYGEGHAEYEMRGLLTNKLPGLRQARWFLILGANCFYANQNFWYNEAYVSIDNLGTKKLRFLRVDLVQSWDPTGARDFGVRLGLRGPVRISLGDNED
jgi:hypothetical protein